MASAMTELQTLIFDRLVADAAVHALIGDRIFDGRPNADNFPCVTFADSDVTPEDAEGLPGRTEVIQIDCWAREGGRRRPAKEIADAVKSSLHEFEGEMSSQALVEMRVILVRTFIDPDGLTAHGIVHVHCMIEEV